MKALHTNEGLFKTSKKGGFQFVGIFVFFLLFALITTRRRLDRFGEFFLGQDQSQWL